MKPPPFRFLNAAELFTLVDAELQLVEPDPRHLDDMLLACQHPLTHRDMPQQASTTRESLLTFLERHPRGRVQEDTHHDIVPGYTFWMRLAPDFPAPVRIAGSIGLRLGRTPSIEMYFGHLGYHVLPPARGHHFAQRACRLLFPLARAHGYFTLWITCNPDNLASRRTCEHLGATLVDTVAVPHDNPLYQQGDRQKCRYRIDLP